MQGAATFSLMSDASWASVDSNAWQPDFPKEPCIATHPALLVSTQ